MTQGPLLDIKAWQKEKQLLFSFEGGQVYALSFQRLREAVEPGLNNEPTFQASTHIVALDWQDEHLSFTFEDGFESGWLSLEFLLQLTPLPRA